MQDILERIGEQEGVPGLLLIAACAAAEYIFPPLPGDAVMIFAAFLVAARGWSAPVVLLSMTLGSMAGGLFQYGLGYWLSQRGWNPTSLRGQQIYAGVQSVAHRFRKHGAAYMAINRFLPGLRSFFWLTAGYVRMPLRNAVGYGGLSALAWSSLLLGLGFVAGDNRAWLEEKLGTYSTAVWAIVGLAALGLGIRWWLGKRTPSGGERPPRPPA